LVNILHWSEKKIMSMLLTDVLPELAAELRILFLQEGTPELEKQVASLKIKDSCRCGDDFCATIYTIEKPDGAGGGIIILCRLAQKKE